MRKATRKISLLLILCMFVSMLPASVAADNSEWLAGAAEPADETAAADSFVYASAPSGNDDIIALTSEELAGSTAEDLPGPVTLPTGTPTTGDNDLGDGVSWLFNTGTRTLTISGKGKMSKTFDASDIPWHSYRNEIVKIDIESKVTLNADCVFSDYSLLSSLTVPAGATIDANAFTGCDKITSVTVSGEWAYLNGELKILSNVDTASPVPWAALKESVNKVVIAANVNSLADGVFTGMTKLTDSGDTRPPVVHYEGTAAQWGAITGGCTDERGLKTGTDTYLLVSFQDGSLIGKCGNDLTFAFDGDTKTLTVSGSGAVSGSAEGDMPWYSVRESVRKLEIEAGVTGIPDIAFKGMENLTDSGYQRQPVVYFAGTKDQWKNISSSCTGEWGLMAETDKYLLVSFEDGSLIGKCGDNATFDFDYNVNGDTKTLTISGNGAIDSFTTSYEMPWYSVRGKVTKLEIAPAITVIGAYAFYSCIELTGVEISENVTSIGNYAFANCDNLENLTIKEGNTPLMIGMYAFWKCSSLINIGSPATTEGTQQPGIPRRVKAIGIAAFRATGLVYRKGGTTGHIYYEGTRDEWAELFDKVNSPDVRDGRLLTGLTGPTGATINDEKTFAVVHCMSTDSLDSLYHTLEFAGGHSSVTGNPPELSEVESSIVAKDQAIKNEEVEEKETDGDGNEVTKVTKVTKVAEDTNFKVPENIFERKGYTFNNWLCDADNEIYKPGEIFIMPAKDVVFTAQWTLDTPKKGDSIDQIVEYLTAEKTKGTSAYPWQAPQDAASSQTELMNWLYKKVPEYLDKAIKASDNSDIKASYRIQVKYFYPAEMGIKNTPLGRNGRFDFDIHLTFKQEIENETKEIKTTAVIKNGVIKAIGYTTANDARYKVTFQFEGGILNRYIAPNHGYTIKEDTTVTWPYMSPGQTFNLPVCTDNTGKDRTFTGWKCSLSEDDFIYRANAPFLMRTGDVTFTAQWDPPSDAAETSLITANADDLKSLAALTGAESVSLKAAKVNPETPEVMQLRAASLEDDMIFVDLTLHKMVDGKTSPLPDTNGTPVAITIPFDDWKDAENVRVYREHGGEIDCLTEGGSGERIAVADGSVTIYAAKFSIYAIAFDRKSSSTGVVNPGTGGSSSSGSISSGGTGSGGSRGGSNGSGSSGGGSSDSRGSSGSSSKPGIVNPAGGSSGSTPAGNVPNGGTPSGKRFNDVAPGAWYYEAANWAYDQKIAKGEGGKRLNPNKLCTRAEMLTFLWRALGSPAPSATGKTFTDVSSGAYYARAVQWAAGQKIVKGEGGKRFNPDAPVTRGEAITLLYRALGAPASAGARFNDVPESAYYAEAVEWAVSRDIAKGVGKRSFSPAAPCTRAQVLTFLYRSQS